MTIGIEAGASQLQCNTQWRAVHEFFEVAGWWDTVLKSLSGARLGLLA